jgi:Zn-dependent alcohol dehydrogenase
VPPLSFRGEPVNYGAPTFTGVFTWAEDTIADQQFVVPLDADVATDATSIIGCAVMTGCGAVVNAAMVRAGESVAVIGAGGVGLCIIQAAANVGAYPIIAVDLTDEKTEFAKQFGATHGINAGQGDPIERLRELTGGGVDYAFDAIGARITIEQSLLAARPRRPGDREGGTAVVVGVPHGDPPTPAMNMIFGGKVYRGAPGGSSRPDRDFPWLSSRRLCVGLTTARGVS